MSSGFISGGTADTPIERGDEWLAAQQELEANRARKAREVQQTDGRSLFETLQANKAAKEEAFAEANRLKNQFRSLDEDEIEFLDSVLESTRAEEARVKKETAEGLAAFRRQQEEADKKGRRGSTETEREDTADKEEESWAAGKARKRKRTKDKDGFKGVKLRKSSTNDLEDKATAEPSTKGDPESNPQPPSVARGNAARDEPRPETSSPMTAKAQTVPDKQTSSLVAYGSDSDDD